MLPLQPQQNRKGDCRRAIFLDSILSDQLSFLQIVAIQPAAIHANHVYRAKAEIENAPLESSITQSP
ncbi:MAG: hypothetical protein D3908_09400 [Candidatus Electrothrix sp. AUS4]|nr:hypothetical protein [Candidatus Electrothrix sp. AUS4]